MIDTALPTVKGEFWTACMVTLGIVLALLI